MAFTGVATVKLVTDSLVRITGLSLAGLAVGTIGLFGDAGADVQLPDGFNPEPFGDVTLEDAVQSWYVMTNPGGGGESRHIHVDKTSPPFRVVYTNDGALPTADFEIYVRFH